MLYHDRLMLMSLSQQLARARKSQPLTQVEAARRLGVTQAYLSLLESSRRKPSKGLLKKAARVYQDPRLFPSAERVRLSPDELATQLGDLGYPGFTYLSKGRPTKNPAEVLLAALCQPGLEARLAEAL